MQRKLNWLCCSTEEYCTYSVSQKFSPGQSYKPCRYVIRINKTTGPLLNFNPFIETSNSAALKLTSKLVVYIDKSDVFFGMGQVGTSGVKCVYSNVAKFSYKWPTFVPCNLCKPYTCKEECRQLITRLLGDR